MLRLVSSGLCIFSNIIYASHAHFSISLEPNAFHAGVSDARARKHTNTQRVIYMRNEQTNERANERTGIKKNIEFEIYDLSMSQSGKSLRVLVQTYCKWMDGGVVFVCSQKKTDFLRVSICYFL